MSLRAAPYRLKPPAQVKETIAQVVGDPANGISGVTMFLLANPAPTTYLVKEESFDIPRRVVIGQRMQCSCGGGLPTGQQKQGHAQGSSIADSESSGTRVAAVQSAPTTGVESGSPQGADSSGIGGSGGGAGGDGELCVHLLWVMLKCLRVPQTHPSVWQLSLLDAEFDTLLAFRERAQQTAEKKRHQFLRRGAGRGGGVSVPAGGASSSGDAQTAVDPGERGDTEEDSE